MIHLMWYIPLCGLIMLVLFWRRNKIASKFTIKDIIVGVVCGLTPVLNILAFLMVIIIELYEVEIWEKEL